MDIVQLLAEKENKKVEGINTDATIRETAQRLTALRIGALVVTDDQNRMNGIVSERDLIPVIAGDGSISVEDSVSEIMTRSVITCGPQDEVSYVMRLMNKNSIRHVPVVEGDELLGMLSIRELTTAYELLQIEANIDPLTEVSNRRPFLKALDVEFGRSQRYGRPLCVAMIDIDHFKSVNDTFGHDAGDKVLREMSGMLINELRTIDLVGRLGGEEFALVFPETDLADAKAACDRLLSRIRASEIEVDGAKIKVTFSVGIADACPGKTSGASVLKRADELLYEAKSTGRNRVVAEYN